MKAVACLVGFCLLAGIVSADYAWETGKSYRYTVSSRALAGISEISNKFAGLQLTYDHIVTPMGGNMVNVKTENLRVTEVHEHLEQGWTQGQIEQGQQAQIPAELQRFVTSPMNMKVIKGVVESIQVEGNLPTWAINIKKSQASTFTADTTGKNVVVEGNLNRQTNSVRPEQANQQSGFFYEVVEQTVHGECEVYYTVSQNGPFDYPYQFQKQSQAAKRSGQSGQQSQSSESQSQSQENHGQQGQRQKQFRNKQGSKSSSSSSSSSSSEERSVEQPWPKAFYSLCQQNDQVYEIIKTINFTTCRQKPVLAFSSPSELNFHPGDNAGGSLWARALITRLLACGQSRQNYTILQITQQEQFQSGLQDKEKVVAGAQKNVTLVSIQNGHPTPVRSPKTINNLVYKFDAQEQEQQKQGKLPMGRFQGSESSRPQQGPLRWSWKELIYGKQQGGRKSSSQESNSGEQNDAGYLQNRGERQQGGRQSSSQENRGQQSSQSTEEVTQTPSSSEESGSGEQGQQQGKLRQPNLDEAPIASMLITPLDRQGIKNRANKLIQEIVEDLKEDKERAEDSIATRETLSKLATLVKALRVLDHKQIHEIHHYWENGHEEQYNIGKQIMVEALAIAGTNPALKEIFELIKGGQLKGEKANIVISTLPLYVRTPTQELLGEMFKLLEDSYVKRDKQTQTSAILAFTTLVYQACVNKKIKNTRYPVALYGEFCSPQHVQQKYAPYFVEKLQKHLQQNQDQDKHMISVYFQALTNLAVPENIHVVQKVLDEQSESFIKVKAIYTLQKMLQSRDNLNQQQHDQQEQQIVSADRQSFDVVTDKLVEKHVLPLLVSVAFDRGEHPEVRIAALDSLIFCTYADTTLWQQIAMSTWFEQSRDVRAFIYNTLYNLAQLEQPLKGTRWNQMQKARQVINLVKPIHASIARSNNVFTSQFFHPVNSGFAQQLQYTASEDSLIPNNIYYKNYFQFGNGAAGVNPLEVALSGQTISKLLYAAYQGFQGQQAQKQQGNEALSKIREVLGITERKQEDPVVGSLFINLRNEMQRLWSFNEQTVEQYARKLVQKVLRSGELTQRVKFQKVAFLGEQVAVMPTILGIPLEYRVRMPSHLSVLGQIQISNPSGPEFQVQADLSPVYSWQIHRQLAFKCPLSGKKYQSGVQRQVVFELPLSIVARRAPRGQIQIAVTPTHLQQSTPKGTIDLVTYTQKPYTAIIHDEFFPVAISQGGQMQVVRVDQKQQVEYSQTHTFGQKSLGLHLQLQAKSDYTEERETVSGWVHFFRQFHSTNCAFNGAWLGSPSIRFVQRKLVLNLDQSETNTLVLVAGAKLQRVLVSEQLASSGEQSSKQQSSSSSSESQEGQQFENVRSRQQYRKQQSRQNKQQSNSSESQEGQQFVNVRSRQQYREQQRRQNKQQSQSQSRSQSQSNSQSQENQGQQRTSQEVNQGPQRNVIAIALLGKKAALKSLERNTQQQHQQRQSSSSSSSSEEQYQSTQRYGQQYNSQEQGRKQSSSEEQYQSTQRYGQQYNSQEQGRNQSSSEEQNQSGQRSGSSSREQGQGSQQQSNSNSQEQGNQGQSGLQRPLQKGSETTVQYLLHLGQSPQGEILVRLSLGDAANQAAQSLPQYKSLQGVREAVVGSPNGKSQREACVQFLGTVHTPKHASRHIIAHTRKSLLEQNLSIQVQAKLQAGKTCGLMPLYVRIQGKLQRDQEMTEWAQTKSPKAQLCLADEKKGFSVSQVCLEVAREQAAALNKLELNIEHSQLPVFVQNYTAKLETLLKSIGYLYLSENQQPESATVQHNQIKLWARMTPNKQFISAHLSLPKSILKFENMKTNKVVRAVLPPTATNTIVGNVQRRLLRSQLHPTCQLEGKYVNTFDNVTYSFNTKVVQGCQTLLAKDCSGRYPMAVYAQDIQKNQDQIVTVILGQKVIRLIPSGVDNAVKGGNTKVGGSSKVVVRVDGQQAQLPHVIHDQQSKSNQPIAEIMVIPSGGVQILGRHIQVASDGKRIVLKIHELLRNRTCGICGDMNNEKVADMRSPRDVPLSSGSLLVASYSFDRTIDGQKNKGTTQQKCVVNPRYQRQAKQEEEIFQSRSSGQYSSKNQKRGQQYISQQQQYHQQQQQQMQMLQQKYEYQSGKSSSQENNFQLGSQESRQDSPRYSSMGRGQSSNQQGSEESRLPNQYSSRRQNRGQQYKKERQQQQQQQEEKRNLLQSGGFFSSIGQKIGEIEASISNSISGKHNKQSYSNSNELSYQWSTTERIPDQGNSATTFATSTAATFLTAPQKIIFEHMTKNKENQVCFTLMKIPACAPGYQVGKTSKKQTRAICVPKGSNAAKQLATEIGNGQFGSKPEEKERSVIISVDVPQMCVQN